MLAQCKQYTKYLSKNNNLSNFCLCHATHTMNNRVRIVIVGDSGRIELHTIGTHI